MKYSNIVILTGAGISAESGLSTFRGEDGLWENHRLEDVATPEAFHRDPDLVHRFYNMRRGRLDEVEPNAAHLALARLEEEYGGRVSIVTQNVDDLHERAGSKAVLHMHGEARNVRCEHCSHTLAWQADLSVETPCPACDKSGGMRPDIVWFGELPFFLDEIDGLLREADLFISIGTSGNVYPAAGYVAQIGTLARAHSIELNLEPSEGQSLFAEKRYGPATEVVTAYVDELLAS